MKKMQMETALCGKFPLHGAVKHTLTGRPATQPDLIPVPGSRSSTPSPGNAKRSAAKAESGDCGD